jgi:hypothetical protein
LDDNAEQLIDKSLSPSKHRDEILPTALRECEAPQDSILAILGRDATCEVQQADWLLTVGRACCQRQAIDSAREHYRKAQQTLAANQAGIDSLPSAARVRYVVMQEHIANNLDACNTELVRLSAIEF